ncbi:MAG: helix-turn-helix transcriptional regulator [Eubacteriales bacterium]|nr:helix-turn-helix transcriptional regulator [Eubacteriales bacterium]
MNFGCKLKELRTGQKMTQQQLVDRIGVAKSVVSYYESGDRYPSYDVLIRIAHVFHTSTDYLLDFEKESVIDVTGLSKEDIAVVRTVAEALKRKRDE